MAHSKAVLFSFWGVAVSSRLDWLGVAVDHVCVGVCVQMIPVLQEECVKEAQVRGITLPSDWSVRSLLEAVREAMVDVQPSVLRTAACLRRSGIRTAVLANHWLDDSAAGDHMGCLLSQLGGHFDLVLQSCRSGLRVPEAAMFSSALQQLGVTSQQAVWLGADEEGVKAAQAVGMKTILVDGLDRALDQLAAFTGVQVEVSAASCGPDEVSHGYVSIRPGVRTHYVEMGSGPPVLLCHGFPESWFSWRHQIPALAAAGFRVLALDMKGYGGSTAPPDVEEYSQEQLCKDFITFLDKMAIPKVTLVGHDWGGALVWNLAKYFPERVRAVASLNTPLFPIDPSAPPGEKLKDVAIFDYQVYFQQPGVAEAELEKNLERTFKIFFFSSSEQFICINTYCCVTGGLLVGLPEQIPRTSMLTEAELQFYVSQYKQTGFRNPLNWYRNSEADWRWMCSRPAAKLLMPALMVTAGKDPVLLPAFSKGMENLIPNLSRGHIEECGHWIQMEKPEETNNILISWLKETHEGWRHRWGS
uniref:AB hydrolase-1 domain-containing protein n=1 Tax=Echeneis naucrates TaxID=173247 RepID=A0A665W6Z3_ECHNA